MIDTRLITIGYAKQAFITESREQQRMKQYAEHFKSMDVIVFTLKKDRLTASVTTGNLTVHSTNSYTRMGALMKAFVIGTKLLWRNKKEACIISTQDPLEPGWVAWLLSWNKNAFFHVQVHGDYFNDIWQKNSPIRRIRQYLCLTLIKRAQAVRTVSKRIKKSLVSFGIREDVISVLPIRPELERFLSHNRVCQGRSEDFVYLFVGRLSPEKNIERIIRSFAPIAKEHKNCFLKIVGSGPEEKKLTSLATELGIEHQVIFEPWTQDVASIMEEADVFVFASLHESHGLVLVEAMAAGLPIVTTHVGCVGDIVQDNVHGIVVEDGSDNSFTQAMFTMFTDEDARCAYGLQGKKQAGTLSTQTHEEYVREWVNTILKTIA